MARGGKKNKRLQDQIAELEIQKRNGLMRTIVAFVGLAAVIACKLTLTRMGMEWANTNFANILIFVLALVAAGVAGFGSRDWMKARDRIKQLQMKLKN